jgi:hypothetical protein
MKQWLIAAGAIAMLAAAASPWGVTAISYLLIPPEHGWYRHWETVDWDRQDHAAYWYYWTVRDHVVQSTAPHSGETFERWDLLREQPGRYFLYDDRDELDGVVTYSRTEMAVQYLDGEIERYPRVLDLWEIWREQALGGVRAEAVRRLAPRREAHRRLIDQRMRASGLAVGPDAEARRRPPVRGVAAPAEPPVAARPLFAVTEFGYQDHTGTTLVIYADGLVISRSLPEDPAVPFHSFHAADAPQLVRQLLGDDFAKQPEQVRLSDSTDQTTTTLWTPNKKVAVYGPWPKPYLREEDPDDPDPALRAENERTWVQWSARAMEVRPLLERIDTIRQQGGQPWLPEKIEVQLGDYENARGGDAVAWPAQWPGLYHSTTHKAAGFYHVFVPAADFARLQSLVENATGRGRPILVDLNYVHATIHFRFPGDKTWLGW